MKQQNEGRNVKHRTIIETALEPFRTNQITTPAALEAHGVAILEGVQAVIECTHGDGTIPHYATVTNAAKYFGMSVDTFKRLLPGLLNNHSVRILRPMDYDGKQSKIRYNLRDLEAAMLLDTETTERSNAH